MFTKEELFFLIRPISAPLEYTITAEERKVVSCTRRIFVFGICIIKYDVFLPNEK